MQLWSTTEPFRPQGEVRRSGEPEVSLMPSAVLHAAALLRLGSKPEKKILADRSVPRCQSGRSTLGDDRQAESPAEARRCPLDSVAKIPVPHGFGGFNTGQVSRSAKRERVLLEPRFFPFKCPAGTIFLFYFYSNFWTVTIVERARKPLSLLMQTT